MAAETAAEEVKEVCEFLKKNNIGGDILERFKNEKMCFEAVKMSTETDLRQLGLAKGDIIKVKHFCANRSEEQKSKENLKEKKELLETILESNKSKRKFHTTKEKLPTSKRSKATSVSRRVQCGWLHFNPQEKCFKVVTQGQGGGPRNLTLPLDATKGDVIEAAKPYYFPGGCSKKHGKEDNMSFSLANFQKQEMSDFLNVNGEETPFTVGAYAEATKLPLLKVFLASRLKEAHDDEKEVYVDDCNDDNDDDTPLMHSIFETKQKVEKDLSRPDKVEWKKSLKVPNHTKDDASTSSLKEDSVINIDSDGDFSDFDVETFPEQTHSKHKFNITKTRELKLQQDAAYKESLKRDQDKVRKANEHSAQIQEQEKMQQKRLLRVPVEPVQKEDSVLIQVRHLTLGIVRRNFSKSCKVLSVYDWVGSMSPVPMHFKLSDHRGKECLPDQPVLDVQRCTLYMTESESTPTLQDGDEVNFKGFGDNKENSDDTIFNDTSNNYGFEIGVVSEHLPQQLFQQDYSPDHEDLDQPSDYAPGRGFRSMVNDMYPTDSETEELVDDVKIIDVERKNVLHDMLTLYEDPSMMNCQLTVRFVGEPGLDFGGLTTDLFTTCWDKAFDEYFEGDAVKIPFVHPLQQLQNRPMFQRLGRILYHGWVLTNQIPVRFSEASLVCLLHGEEAVDEDVLERSFLLYLSQFERDVLIQGLSTSNLASFQQDAIHGIYQQYNMNCLPAKDPKELRKHVVIMARTQFVYKPMSILMWMRNGIGEKITVMQSHLNKEEIQKLYKVLMPSKEKVLAKLTYSEDLRPEESRVLTYLRNFIGTSTDELLDRFIRFVTGSPAAPQREIKISFNATVGLRRAPSSSTCGYVLHLPTSYTTFKEFRNEFSTVLLNDTSFEMGVH